MIKFACFFCLIGLGPIPFTFANDQQTSLERGSYLVQKMLSCTHCHGEDLGGAEGITIGGFISNAPNITNDADSGLGSWSDNEIISSIRNGIRPDGTNIGAPMPIDIYRNLADSDLRAIVAYLRSIPQVQRTVKATQTTIKTRKAHDQKVEHVIGPDFDDPISRGQYIYNLTYCTHCHNPRGKMSHLVGAGGTPFKQEDGAVIYSSNLTPSGNLPNYTDNELAKLIRTGQRPDGSMVLPPMPAGLYTKLSDQDINDLILFLRNLTAAETPSQTAN
ncbi:c-type cytochrome [Thalassotalea sp. PS06]|uniref:c-type cytochrome n=1 Tax=Thalassotalea sp. PS06 TaxID=2594005 RepID=UPI001164CEB2|nr:cytochrome c [Thalassotalea sp. PS06]QDP02653.1 cytochrome c [Thalassotalea sp. PS06]